MTVLEKYLFFGALSAIIIIDCRLYFNTMKREGLQPNERGVIPFSGFYYAFKHRKKKTK